MVLWPSKQPLPHDGIQPDVLHCPRKWVWMLTVTWLEICLLLFFLLPYIRIQNENKGEVLLFCRQSLKVKHSDDLKSQHWVNNEKHLDPKRLQMDCLQLLVPNNSSTTTPSRTPLTCISDHSACFLLYLLLVCKLSRRTSLNPPNTGAHLNHQVGVNRDTTHSKPSIGFNTLLF